MSDIPVFDCPHVAEGARASGAVTTSTVPWAEKWPPRPEAAKYVMCDSCLEVIGILLVTGLHMVRRTPP